MNDHTQHTDQVAVVVPTRNRPTLVARAVRSALAQSYPIEELIVVVDGDDPSTVDALREFTDARLRVIVLPHSGGSNNARNIGASLATSNWVAFLDDDDEWFPHKISAQLQAVGDCDIASCRFVAQSSNGAMAWPRQLPKHGQRFGDYLFERRSFFNGEAAILTSTLMVRKSLFDRLQFSTTLRRHQDADWVIRATSCGAKLVYVPQVLVKFNDEIGRARISTNYNWRESLRWIQSIRHLMGRRAYAGFVLTSVGPAASEKHQLRAIATLLFEATTKGRPTPLHLALYVGMWLFPQNMRQRLRVRISRFTSPRALFVAHQQSAD